ncbi:MAG: flagellar hook-length control protein FliK [Gammaproteobacteria bacterium]|nr:flagellar hook-length control protein FliK [Gammaproteobacteria bacterium]
MLIPELQNTQIALQPQTGGQTLRAWTAGQILSGLVVRQAADGTVTLRIGNQEMQARTGLALSADQPLTLQVAQTGAQVVLRVLHVSNLGVAPDAPLRTTPVTPEAALAQALRAVLPRAGDLSPLLTLLAGTPEGLRPDTHPSALPAPVSSLLRLLAMQIPAIENLFTAPGLRKALLNSGLFLESQIAQSLAHGTAPALEGDFKARLAQLVNRLQLLVGNPAAYGNEAGAALRAGPDTTEVTTQWLRQADAALARIEQNQITSLLATPDGRQVFLLEIPVRDGSGHQTLQLRIEEDNTGEKGDSPAPWTVWLDFNLGALGPLRARVGLSGNSLTASFWAEQPATAELIQARLTELDQALHRAGIENVQLHARAGMPATAANDISIDTLLDERA